MLYIGIDPDTKESGVAIWDGKRLELSCCTFFELFPILRDLTNFKKEVKSDIKVIIECGFLHPKSNWHNERQGVRVAARIGKNTGANHETARKIIEMCEYLTIPYEMVKPVNHKLGAKEFKKLTGYQLRTNQEARDAAMLVWGR